MIAFIKRMMRDMMRTPVQRITTRQINRIIVRCETTHDQRRDWEGKNR